MTTSAEVRKALVATLALDLIGPGRGILWLASSSGRVIRRRAGI